MKVLHVLNYAWPYIDGYTARSIGLIGAQTEHLDGVEPQVAVSPFEPLAQGRDERFTTPSWGPGLQLRAARHANGAAVGTRSWERPALGLAPATAGDFRRELESVARRTGAQIVHVHHPHYIAGPALDVAATLGLPAVFELRCFNGYYDLGTGSPIRTLRGQWQNRLDLELAREASAVVTIADGLAGIMTRNGVSPERLTIVRNSVDTTRFHPGGKRDAFATRAAGSDGLRELHVGYATTFERIENLDEAVRAAAIAAPELAGQGIRLIMSLAGTGRDLPRIRTLVDELQLGDTVRLPGLVPYGEMPDFYTSLDLFLVPRGAHAVSMDTTPLKPLEALACGLPLVVTDLPAMRELLAEREDVRFTTPAASAMAEAIAGFAREPFTGRGAIAERAWPLEVQRYHEVYDKAMRSGPPRASGRRAFVRRLREGAGGLSGDLKRGVALALEPTRRADDGARTTHLVVCGYPRSGSTLLQQMLEHGDVPVRGFQGEVEAMDALDARAPDGRLVTKHPDDVLEIERIAGARRDAGGQARFVFTVRDPRDVMTSRHQAYSAERGYYVEPERFVRTTRALLAARERSDGVVVRYEDLVEDTARVSDRIAALTHWPLASGFGDWYQRAERATRDSMTEGALGGLRRPEPGGVARWKAPEHHDRIARLVATCPMLLEAVTALGYEPDDTWADAWRDTSTRAPVASTASSS